MSQIKALRNRDTDNPASELLTEWSKRRGHHVLYIPTLAKEKGWSLDKARAIVSRAVYRAGRYKWTKAPVLAVRLRSTARLLSSKELETMSEDKCFEYVKRSWAEPLDCVYFSTTPNGAFLTASLRYRCARTVERATYKLEAASEAGLLKASLPKALKAFGVVIARPLPEGEELSNS